MSASALRHAAYADAATVEGAFPIGWPRVPGHEAVGRIDALGEGVEGWRVGQRAIAEAYWQIHRQPRSAWSHEIDLRPFKESF